jgi:hypothetical protein
MILVTHIVIALASLVFAATTLWLPTKEKLRISSLLAGLTIASGTVLVITTSSPLLQACMTGLGYLAVIFSAMAMSYYRIQKTNQ